MRCALAALVLLSGGLVVAPPAARAEDEEAIRYDQPEAYRRVAPEMAEGGRLASLASQLRGEDPRRSLGQAARWIHRNVRPRADAPAAFRTFDELLKERGHAGAADLSVLVGVFARGLGIPTIWVKAAKVDDLRAVLGGTGRVEDLRVGVYLEVFWDSRWRLLDPVSMRLWDGYDPQQRLLPDGYLALEKGGDPAAMALPGTGREFLERLRKQLGSMDLRRLPWGSSSDLLAPWRVYIAGTGFGATYAKEACRATGYLAQDVFNGDWDANLARARGAILMVMCEEPRTFVLPERYWGAWLPPGHAELARGGAPPRSGFLAHRLSDGTRVILVCPADATETEAVAAAALEE